MYFGYALVEFLCIMSTIYIILTKMVLFLFCMFFHIQARIGQSNIRENLEEPLKFLAGSIVWGSEHKNALEPLNLIHRIIIIQQLL